MPRDIQAKKHWREETLKKPVSLVLASLIPRT